MPLYNTYGSSGYSVGRLFVSYSPRSTGPKPLSRGSSDVLRRSPSTDPLDASEPMAELSMLFPVDKAAALENDRCRHKTDSR